MRDDRNIQPPRAPMGIAAPRRYTVAPHIYTPVTIRTLPHAVCCVHAEADSNPKRSLKVYADGEGVVRFHIRPCSATHDIARLEVDCAADDKLVRYPLHLRVSLVPSVEMPSPPVEKLSVRPNPDEQASTEQDATDINLGFIQVTLTNYFEWDRVPAGAADRAGDQQLHHQSGR